MRDRTQLASHRSCCTPLSGPFCAIPPIAPISLQVIITCLGRWRNISRGRSLVTATRPKMRCWGG
jgi:hypothetical protein